MNSTSLLPCPFCGQDPEVEEFDEDECGPAHVIISCPGGLCPSTAIAYGDTRAEAIAAWNTRHVPSIPVYEMGEPLRAPAPPREPPESIADAIHHLAAEGLIDILPAESGDPADARLQLTDKGRALGLSIPTDH
ncbi:Lar family restriction alleviation protein [Haloferula sargassicola]|uniref:Uncharacterized protein n=1 Tax=Haloferula sargassicola TaxID=490096 RepID=A0ABP9UQL6_9BACT